MRKDEINYEGTTLQSAVFSGDGGDVILNSHTSDERVNEIIRALMIDDVPLGFNTEVTIERLDPNTKLNSQRIFKKIN